jgi:chromosome segregation ATPase
MKKIFVMAFLALGLSAMAQHVAPLTIEIADPQVDSLRAKYLTEPAMYRAALEAVSLDLAKNSEQIKAAKSELKDEQNHAKEMDGSLKEALKMTAELKKVYDKEEVALKAMQKTIEKQQRKLASNRRLNKTARENYAQMLEKQQKELGYSLREVAERQHSVSDLETSIQNWQTSLQYFVQETVQKEGEIAKLEALCKQRQAELKAELKAAKKIK